MKEKETTRRGEGSSQNNDCDIDWALYHMLNDEKTVMIAELVEQSGWSRDVVEASLSRLENNRLITVMCESVGLLSLSDVLVLNEMTRAPDMPVYIENGVIKAKKQC